MKNMKNFAAQQLSKKQMNNVKGGASANCVTTNPQGIVVASFKLNYEEGTEGSLQGIVDAVTPIGCVTVCRRA
ncbi:MAG: hypothetical protein NC548_27930 [Lachnospiraceae bacterium]|nr:hypothetical protein [Lachnospiraceae bacterium]